MKILITGGCGFLGTNLGREALARGISLCVLDNLSRIGAETNLTWLRTLGTFDFHHQDVRNAESVAAVVRGFQPDAIFHVAGQVAMTTSIANPRADFETNSLGTLNVLEAVRAHCPQTAIIYSSTNKVYGDLEWVTYEEKAKRYVAPDYPRGFPENTPLNFRSPYGCSKGAADQYLLDYARVYGLRTVVFRHSSIYGGRQFATFDQGWIGWFCQKALEQRAHPDAAPFTIAGTGKQVRDVLYGSDAVACYFAALANIDQVRGHVFNIGGGMENSLSLLELFDILAEFTGGNPLRYTQTPWRASDQKVFVADISMAQRLLKWKPKVDCRAGIREMVAWQSSIKS